MRISDWSSDVCSSDLIGADPGCRLMIPEIAPGRHGHLAAGVAHHDHRFDRGAAFDSDIDIGLERNLAAAPQALIGGDDDVGIEVLHARSEEHTSELPSLMRISYAVL